MKKTTWISSILVFSLIISFCCCLQGQAVYADEMAGHACCDMEGGHQKGEKESHGDCDCGSYALSENAENTNSLQIVSLLFVQKFYGSIESQSQKVNFLSFLKFPSSSSLLLFKLHSNYRL